MAIVGDIESLKCKHMARHSLNTIVGGFSGGGETSSTRKRYVRIVMHVRRESPLEETDNQATITFSKKDAKGVIPHKDDLMVIKVQIQNWNVRRVLVNLGSSIDVLYLEAFKGIKFDITELLPFKGFLVGFLGETSHVLGYLPMITTFDNGESAKSVLIEYLTVKVISPYNIIIGKPSFNALEAALFTLCNTLFF